jgi:ribosomal protein S18 acetylase RimI-like enzyme
MRVQLDTTAGTRVALRAASSADEPFLYELFADRRALELARVGWPEAAMRGFLDLQFRAQQQGYGGAFPHADHWVVVEGSAPVGRLLLERGADWHVVVDLVLLTRCRSRGIGTALMEAVLDDAADAGVPVRLTAAVSEPRLVAWYERLGFRVVERGDLAVVMVGGG